MLIDRARISVRSGKGGDGHVSFRREKFVPKGGPDGGDGGDGGSVVIVAREGVDTLWDLAGHHHWQANDGEPGGPKQCHGASRDDLEVPVPPGTLVYDAVTNELLDDLDGPGHRLVVARGGQGGFGNEHFKSATNQTPRRATPGRPAEQRTLRLELRLIADIGLIGMPNAGKSTLLRTLSSARPKVADYPFTTLHPFLGIAELSGPPGGHVRRLVFADIPGLIEGASQGKGLGHDFLRHVDRTRLLVHLVELEPTDGSDPVENFKIICGELGQYSSSLAEKPHIVALSKMDLMMSDEDRETAADLFQQAIGRSVSTFSSVTGYGVRALLEKCWEAINVE